MAAKHVDHPAQRFLAAEFRIDLVVVDDVVAVRGAGAGFQQRRGVEVADAEAGEVGDQFGAAVEREVAMELQARGGAQWGHLTLLACASAAMPGGDVGRIEQSDDAGPGSVVASSDVH